MLRLSVLLVLVAVSCYAKEDEFDFLDDFDLFGEDENRDITTRRLVSLLENLDRRAFPEYRSEVGAGVGGQATGSSEEDNDPDDAAPTTTPEPNDVEARDLAILVEDLERRLFPDLEIDDRSEVSGDSEEDTLNEDPTSAPDREMEARDEYDGRPRPTPSAADDIELDQRRFSRKTPYFTILLKVRQIQTMIFARKAGLLGPQTKNERPTMIIPEYFYNYTITGEVYDEIDYSAARSQIEDAVRDAVREEIPPKELIYLRVAPILYSLRSGCTVNLLQRLVSAGLDSWTEKNTARLMSPRRKPNKATVDVIQSVNDLIMSEINRTVFGCQFKNFESVLDFMAEALTENRTSNPAEFVYNMSTNILQCTPRPAFLENFIARTRTFRSRVLYVNPLTFTIRLLKSAPNTCGSQQPARVFRNTLVAVKRALRPIQLRLRRLFASVYKTLTLGIDQPIADIFPGYLEPNKLALLRKVLGMLRAEGSTPEAVTPSATPTIRVTPSATPTSRISPTASSTLRVTPTPTAAARSYDDRQIDEAFLERLLKRLVA